MTISVLLVEDHPLYREGLAAALSRPGSDVRVVGEAGDGGSGLRMARDLQPDVAVVDLGLPDIDGATLIPRLNQHCPGIRVLVITGKDDELSLAAALDSGARGVLTKMATASQILGAVRAVAVDGGVFDPGVARSLLRRAGDAASSESVGLTGRELQVLCELARVGSNRAIATSLQISVKTVDNHLHNVFAKLGVHDRAQAVLQGVRLGLVPLGSPEH